MGGIRVEGGVSGRVAEVDAGFNVQVALPTDPDFVGSVRMQSENDNGTITGAQYLKSPETSRDYRLRVGVDTILHYDEFNSTLQNSSINRHAFVTMTATLGSGSMLFNANSTLTAATGVQHATFRTYPIMDTAPLYTNHTISFTAAPLVNQVVEWGLFPTGAGNVAPTDGVYFRYTSAGISGVLNFNGTETATVLRAALIPANDTRKYVLVLGEKAVEFWEDDKLLGSITVPAANGKFCLSGSLPINMQFRNSGAVTGAPVMQAKLSDWSVSLADLHTSKPWAGQMCGMGLSGYQTQNGAAPAQTAQWANTTTPAAAAATNTTAALGSGFGGLFLMNAPVTGTTDLIVQSYQNPIGAVGQTPRVIFVRGVWVDVINTGAAVATTATILALAIAFGHTAVSLATTESASLANATTKAPRRMPIGAVSFAVGSVIGVKDKVYVDFEAPIVVQPGEFIQLIAKPILGTATASQVLVFTIGYNAYQE